MAAPSLWREELRRAWYELRGTRTTPARAAAAVALGLFIGSIPAYGTHTPLVLAICLWLQLDALLAWVASNVSNPLFSPFLLTAELQIGSYLHTGEALPLHRLEAALETGFSGMLLYLFSGAALVALALALSGGGLTFALMRLKRQLAPVERPRYRLPADAPAWWHATERIAGRYAPVPDRSTAAQRSRFHYVRIKMLGDPVAQLVAREAERLGGLGEVVDVGSGRGQLALMLLELGRCARVHGIDWDDAKVESARAAAAVDPALAATFEQGDVRRATLPEADTVMLIDVLHYLDVADQDALLARSARALRPGGTLLLREADTERGWRSWATWLEERVFTLLRFNRGARVRFRAASELTALLEGEGLRCRVVPAWGKTPFSNVLVVASRT